MFQWYREHFDKLPYGLNRFLESKNYGRFTKNWILAILCSGKNLFLLLPPFQNDWWIVDARFKMKWSIILTITAGTSTLLQKIAQWESTNHSGTEGVISFISDYSNATYSNAPGMYLLDPK